MKPIWTLTIAALLSAVCQSTARAQEVPPFHEYDPPSTLVVPEHPVSRARYPFVDVHNHQFGMPDQDLAELTAAMDELNMAVMVNLSGRGFRRLELAEGKISFDLQEGEYLQRAVENVRQNAPGRVLVFTNIRLQAIDDPDWTERTLRQLEIDVKNGAQGLKIYKNLGLTEKDSGGERMAVDDPRLAPVWKRCGELGIPVLIHTGEPAPFWQPKDANNERLQELMEKPERYRNPEIFPSWEDVMAEQHRVFRQHPETIFINAHLGWMGNDLERLGRLLDELPNVYTEIGAVLAELGRQPRFAREWLIQYQDRVLFGKDSWRPEEYPVYFRVLETADEYFDYYRRRHAFWKMYGLDLPDEVLKRIYYKNALAILPGLDASLFPE
jgi:predicted TIM-barrel fold metal-dependent hydrolase